MPALLELEVEVELVVVDSKRSMDQTEEEEKKKKKNEQKKIVLEYSELFGLPSCFGAVFNRHVYTSHNCLGASMPNPRSEVALKILEGSGRSS